MDKQALFIAHKAYAMRVNSILMTTQAGSGHPTSALSAADIVAVLFFYGMRFDLHNPDNPNNDRFILSKGHASPILYAVYKELGVLSEEQLLQYRSFDSVLEGHPTSRFAWTEAATGSLGQGLSIGVGMGLNARMDKRDYYTYVLLGDSEISEGSVWEAAELAAFYKLHNIVAIIDVNRLGQTGQTMEGYDLEDIARKFSGFGWHPLLVDGHDVSALIAIVDQARQIKDKPTVIIAKTMKGYGTPVENKNGYHGKPFVKQEEKAVLAYMKQQFANVIHVPDYTWVPKVPKKENVPVHKKIVLDTPPFDRSKKLATRKAFGLALENAGKKTNNIVVLDGEVKNSTYTEYFADAFPAHFVQSFIAEQNMIGMAVGFAKRGKIALAATFAAFFSRAFDQIRMAAIGKSPLRLVGSHAGVSIGQDGPSQMGLEDIAMMRTLPDSIVLYPADAISTWKLLECMLNWHDSISYLRTTRMDTPIIYDAEHVFSIGGCSVLKQSSHDSVCLVAAGVTLFEALKAHEQLAGKGIYVSVIDLYSIKPLDATTLKQVIGKSGKRVITIEDHYQAGGIGEAVADALKNECFAITNLCVNKLPRSAKPEELLAYEHIDAQAIIQAVQRMFQ